MSLFFRSPYYLSMHAHYAQAAMTISRVTSPSTTKAGPFVATINLRRGQRLAFETGRSDRTIRVKSGCLVVMTTLPARRRQVIVVLHPGDTLASDALPALDGLEVVAAVASAVERWRLPASPSGAVPQEQPEGEAPATTSRLVSRMALHAVALGRLDGVERLATLLIEQSLELGRATPGGYTFDNPMSRADMADYLALNPDTLSRLMSRLKASGAVAAPSRSKVIVKDFAVLCAMSPLSGALIDMYKL